MMETEKSAHFCCGTVDCGFYMLVLTLFSGFCFCQSVRSFAGCSACVMCVGLLRSGVGQVSMA